MTGIDYSNISLHHALFDGFISANYGNTSDETIKSIIGILNLEDMKKYFVEHHKRKLLTDNLYFVSAKEKKDVFNFIEKNDKPTLVYTGTSQHAVSLLIKSLEKDIYSVTYTNTGDGCNHNGLESNVFCNGIIKYDNIERQKLNEFLDILELYHSDNKLIDTMNLFDLLVLKFLTFDDTKRVNYFQSSIEENIQEEQITMYPLNQSINNSTIQITTIKLHQQLSGSCSFRSIFYPILYEFCHVEEDSQFVKIETEVKWILLNHITGELSNDHSFLYEDYKHLVECSYLLYSNLLEKYPELDTFNYKDHILINIKKAKQLIRAHTMKVKQIFSFNYSFQCGYKITQRKDKDFDFSAYKYLLKTNFGSNNHVEQHLINVIIFYTTNDLQTITKFVFVHDIENFLINLVSYCCENTGNSLLNDPKINILLFHVLILSYSFYRTMELSMINDGMIIKFIFHKYLKAVFGEGLQIMETFNNGSLVVNKFYIDFYLNNSKFCLNALNIIEIFQKMTGNFNKLNDFLGKYRFFRMNEISPHNNNIREEIVGLINKFDSTDINTIHLYLLFAYYTKEKNILDARIGSSGSINTIILKTDKDSDIPISTDLNFGVNNAQDMSIYFTSNDIDFKKFDNFLGTTESHVNYANIQLQNLISIVLNTQDKIKLPSIINTFTCDYRSIGSYFYHQTNKIHKKFIVLPFENVFVEMNICELNQNNLIKIFIILNEIKLNCNKLSNLLYIALGSIAIFSYLYDKIPDDNDFFIVLSELVEYVKLKLDDNASDFVPELINFHNPREFFKIPQDFRQYITNCMIYLMLKSILININSEIKLTSDDHNYFSLVFYYMQCSIENKLPFYFDLNVSDKKRHDVIKLDEIGKKNNEIMLIVFSHFISNNYHLNYKHVLGGKCFYNVEKKRFEYIANDSSSFKVEIKESNMKDNKLNYDCKLTPVGNNSMEKKINISLTTPYNKMFVPPKHLFYLKKPQAIYPFFLFWSKYLVENYTFVPHNISVDVINPMWIGQRDSNLSFSTNIFTHKINVYYTSDKKTNNTVETIKCEILIEGESYLLNSHISNSYIQEILFDSFSDYTIWYNTSKGKYIVYIHDALSIITYDQNEGYAEFNQNKLIMPGSGDPQDKLALSWACDKIKKSFIVKKENKYYIVACSFNDKNENAYEGPFGDYGSISTQIDSSDTTNKLYYIGIDYNFLTIDLTDNEAFIVYLYNWLYSCDYSHVYFMLKSFQLFLVTIKPKDKNSRTNSSIDQNVLGNLIRKISSGTIKNLYSIYFMYHGNYFENSNADFQTIKILNIFPKPWGLPLSQNMLDSDSAIKSIKLDIPKIIVMMEQNQTKSFCEQFSTHDFFKMLLLMFRHQNFTIKSNKLITHDDKFNYIVNEMKREITRNDNFDLFNTYEKSSGGSTTNTKTKHKNRSNKIINHAIFFGGTDQNLNYKDLLDYIRTKQIEVSEKTEYDNFIEFETNMYKDIYNSKKAYPQEKINNLNNTIIQSYYNEFDQQMDFLYYLISNPAIYNNHTELFTQYISTYSSPKVNQQETNYLTLRTHINHIRLYEFLCGFFFSQEQYLAMDQLIQNIMSNDQTKFFQFIMGGGKTAVIIPVVAMSLVLENKLNVCIVQPDHLVRQMNNIIRKGIGLILHESTFSSFDGTDPEKYIVPRLSVMNDTNAKLLKLYKRQTQNIAFIFDEVDDLANNTKSELNIVKQPAPPYFIKERFRALFDVLYDKSEKDIGNDENYLRDLGFDLEDISEDNLNKVKLATEFIKKIVEEEKAKKAAKEKAKKEAEEEAEQKAKKEAEEKAKKEAKEKMTLDLLTNVRNLETEVEKVRNDLKKTQEVLLKNFGIVGGSGSDIQQSGLDDFMRNIGTNIKDIVFKNKWRLDYGLRFNSSNSNDFDSDSLTESLFAVPYLGKDIPSKTSEFNDNDIKLGFTILSYKEMQYLRPTDINRMLDHYYMKYSDAINSKNTLMASLVSKQYEYFIRDKINPETILPNIRLFYSWETMEEKFGLSAKKIFSRKILEIYLLHMLTFIDDKVEMHNISFIDLLSNDTSIYKVGITGTPYIYIPMDEGKIFKNLKMQIGGNGFILEALFNTYDDIQIIRKEDVLNDLLKIITKPEDKYMTLIDCDAVLLKYDNCQVAKEIYDAFKKINSKISSVVYIRSDHMLMEYNGNNQGPIIFKSRPELDYFVFFDQAHITGIDIKIKKGVNGLITVSSKTHLRDVAQATFRLRDINISQKITYVSIDNLVPNQYSSLYEKNHEIIKIFAKNETDHMKAMKRSFNLQMLRTLYRNFFYQKKNTSDKLDNKYFLLVTNKTPFLNEIIRHEVQKYQKALPAKSSEQNSIENKMYKLIDDLMINLSGDEFSKDIIQTQNINVNQVQNTNININMSKYTKKEIDTEISREKFTKGHSYKFNKNPFYEIKLPYLFDDDNIYILKYNEGHYNITNTLSKVKTNFNFSLSTIEYIIQSNYLFVEIPYGVLIKQDPEDPVKKIYVSTYILFLLYYIFTPDHDFRRNIILCYARDGCIFIMTNIEFCLLKRDLDEQNKKYPSELWKPIHQINELGMSQLAYSFIKLLLKYEPSANDVEVLKTNSSNQKLYDFLISSFHETYFFTNVYRFPYNLFNSGFMKRIMDEIVAKLNKFANKEKVPFYTEDKNLLVYLSNFIKCNYAILGKILDDFVKTRTAPDTTFINDIFSLINFPDSEKVKQILLQSKNENLVENKLLATCNIYTKTKILFITESFKDIDHWNSARDDDDRVTPNQIIMIIKKMQANSLIEELYNLINFGDSFHQYVQKIQNNYSSFYEEKLIKALTYAFDYDLIDKSYEKLLQKIKRSEELLEVDQKFMNEIYEGSYMKIQDIMNRVSNLTK